MQLTAWLPAPPLVSPSTRDCLLLGWGEVWEPYTDLALLVISSLIHTGLFSDSSLLQKLLLALTLARCVDLERQCCYLTGEEVGQSPRCCEFIPAISGILDCLAYKQDGQGCSQSSEIILKSVLPISGKLDLLGNQNSRESVIKTPTGSPSLQTPSNSLEQLQAQGLDSENRNSYSIQLIDTRSDLDSDRPLFTLFMVNLIKPVITL